MKLSLGKNFYFYSLGQLVSQLGDVTAYLALSWWVLQKTGSGLQFAMVLVPVAVIQIFLQPLLSPIVDRYSRKHIMIISDLLRMIGSSVAFLMIYLDYFNLSALILIACLGAVFTAGFESSIAGLTRFLVPEEKLESALRVSQILSGLKSFVNPAMAGTLVAFAGPAMGTLFNVLSYAAALILNSFLVLDRNSNYQEKTTAMIAFKTWWHDLNDGFMALMKTKVIFQTLLLIGVFQFLLSHLSVTLPVLILQERKLVPFHLGLIESAIGIGSLVGALTLKWGYRLLPGLFLWVVSFLSTGMGLFILGLSGNLVITIVALATMMICQTWMTIQFQTKLSLAVPRHYLGRVFSFVGLLTSGMMPLGFALAGGLVETFSAGKVISASGIMYFLSFPLLFLVPLLSEFLTKPQEQIEQFISEKYPQAFKADT